MYNSRNKNKVKQYRTYLSKIQDYTLDIQNGKFANKHKIRNWHQLVKKLNSVKQQFMMHNVDIDELKKHLDDNYNAMYVEVEIDRFDRYIKRNPPLWFKKLYLKALMDIFTNWQPIAEKLGEEYYLKIWLFEPNFYQSQVVLCVKNGIPWYNKLFGDQDKATEFPHARYTDLKAGIDTHNLTWELKKETRQYSDDDLNYLPNNYIAEQFKAGKAWEYDDVTVGKITALHVGDVWLGTK